ncbi:uncharacterized protein LOC106754808 [Vigna radiata var. radiata]|uniref:Uncharacterized protein LOC106754808 n=1 Tax=Vigna radiata var. radiata TaxID=3916 RepID=A0A1S3TF12_VIGRR|nr:uncharacterized protein LOC106754808 [Vigna radiata var. radiata]
MAPFEALYGRKCRTPLCWFQEGEAVLTRPEIIQQTTEKVKSIQERLKASQSRQKSYADRRRRPLEFVEGEHVFLRLNRAAGVGRVVRPNKLSPRFIGAYQILRCIGTVAYELALPPQLSNLHSIFHVSQLRKYIADRSHVLEDEDVQIKGDCSVELQLIKVDEGMKRQSGKTTTLIKVIWDNRTGDTTWEKEEDMKESYPHLFSSECPHRHLERFQRICSEMKPPHVPDDRIFLKAFLHSVEEAAWGWLYYLPPEFKTN